MDLISEGSRASERYQSFYQRCGVFAEFSSGEIACAGLAVFHIAQCRLAIIIELDYVEAEKWMPETPQWPSKV
jgi:hypothetical protein